MSRRGEDFFMRFGFAKDPLDDSLNASWDAVVRRERATSPEVDPDDVAFLRRVHALEAVALPSPSFFGDLEQRLTGMYSPPVSSPDRVPWVKDPRPSVAQPAPKRPVAFPRAPRLFSMQSALAALAIMVVVSLLVLYQGVPKSSEPPVIPAAVIAKPAIESITQFEFVPTKWGMPDATEWTHMESSLLSLAPATSFTTDWPWYIADDGPLALTVVSGELTVTPAGPAFFYPTHQSGQSPVEISPGETVSLGLDDTIVYSSTDTAAGSNPGSEPALILYGLVGKFDGALPGNSVRPNDVVFIAHDYDSAPFYPSLPTAGATVTLQRLELAPFDTFVFDPDLDLQYLPLIDPAQTHGLRIEEGELDELAPNPGAQRIYVGTQLRDLKGRPHTIFNLGDETVAFYFFVVEPFPDAATPPA